MVHIVLNPSGVPTMHYPLLHYSTKYESVHSSSCINIQECVNLEGAYNCVCRQGYEKQIPKGIDDPEIILGSDLGIESKTNYGMLWKYLLNHTVKKRYENK